MKVILKDSYVSILNRGTCYIDITELLELTPDTNKNIIFNKFQECLFKMGFVWRDSGNVFSGYDDVNKYSWVILYRGKLTVSDVERDTYINITSGFIVTGENTETPTNNITIFHETLNTWRINNSNRSK